MRERFHAVIPDGEAHAGFLDDGVAVLRRCVLAG
jgi:hypothetical protein